MRIGLFIPCYIDQLYPQVGVATVEVLEAQGIEVDYPTAQTCCGQPMANTGCRKESASLAKRFVEIFAPYDHVVCPSGSCVSMVRNHYADLGLDDKASVEVCRKTFELCEFLVDVVQVKSLDVSFPAKVGIHESCHGLRELRLGSSSERVGPEFSKIRSLLELVDGVQFAKLNRTDECCGFGGTFAVNEEAVSCMMGDDRIRDHTEAKTEVLTAGDMSCLMHLDGLLRRGKKEMRVMHVAEILAGKS